MGEPFAVWTEELSVGVTALDNDHKKMIAILNELHDGIMAGHKREILTSVFDHLLDYSKFHFANEEELFAKINYPFAPAHKREHLSFVTRIENLNARSKKAPAALIDLELMSFLRNWLVTHIQGSDRQYGPHLNAKGIH